MQQPDRKGYSWLFLDAGLPWINNLGITLLIIIMALASFFAYGRISDDTAPDSIAGYSYAILALLCMVMASVLYTRKRKSRQRRVGELNASLNWHVSLGVLALLFVFLHSFGNFNPRTGTYALYGMLALVISGFVGRFIDRLVPRLIACDVRRVLTEAGEDRLEVITQNVQALISHNTQELRALKAPANRAHAYGVSEGDAGRGHGRAIDPVSLGGTALPGSWDIAYISLAETPQEIKSDTQQYRFVPDRKSPLNQPGALVPGLQENMDELKIVQYAIQREQFYRALIRYWRIFHVLLVIVTIGLTLWHLEYAAQLLIPTFLHH